MFEDGWPGGAKIFAGDLNSEAGNEKIVVNGSRLEIFNSEGSHWYDDYPFGSAKKEDLRLAVGPLAPGEKPGLVLGSSNRGNIVVLNYHGGVLADQLYPLGKKYRAGFSVGIARQGPDKNSQLILGTGRGVPTKVVIFDADRKKVTKEFYPFEKNYTGGVSVAAADFNGDGVYEIAVASGYNRKPMVRFFNLSGKKISEFGLSGIFSGKPVTLSATTPDEHGKSDLVVNNGN